MSSEGASSTALVTEPGATSGRLGALHFAVVGQGEPVSIFAHGLGGSSEETRPLAARVPGTRILMNFRGHGSSEDLEDGWDYDLLADDLLSVADHVGATSALGLSLGAGALLRLLNARPTRFERLAFVLPAALDQARDEGVGGLYALRDALNAGDVDAVTALLLQEVPASARESRGVQLLVARRAARLLGRPVPEARSMEPPVEQPERLARIVAPALVIGEEGDELHPVSVARQLARTLPNARLVTGVKGNVFWTASRKMQEIVGEQLDSTTPLRKRT